MCSGDPRVSEVTVSERSCWCGWEDDGDLLGAVGNLGKECAEFSVKQVPLRWAGLYQTKHLG